MRSGGTDNSAHHPGEVAHRQRTTVRRPSAVPWAPWLPPRWVEAERVGRGTVTRLADLARRMFAAALDAIRPRNLLRRVEMLPDGVRFGDATLCPGGRFVLVALGKAAPGLAGSFLASARRQPDRVFVLAPDGVPAPQAVVPHLRRASHPLPDERGAAATEELLTLLATLGAEDGVLLLLSGGASALLAAPLPGLALETVAAVSRSLLHAGASIGELNVVRKHLLAAAGGRLAAACPASLLTLVLSDVPGDDLSLVASGPTVADPSTRDDALAILSCRGLLDAFPAVRGVLGGREAETPKAGDARLARTTTLLLGSSADALAAAGAIATHAGFRTVHLTRTLRGEAREVGRALAGLGRAAAGGEPVALLAAGETTVRVVGTGRGGRNLELALGAALELAGSEGICLLAGGSDGVDGTSPAAGAVVDGWTVHRGARRGLDAGVLLADNDAWGFFAGSEEAILTGPTGTNVADLVFVLCAGAPAQFLPAVLRDGAWFPYSLP